MPHTILCDFDGTLHSMDSGWCGPRTIPDAPVDGAIEWLLQAVATPDVEVAVYSTRSHHFGGRRAMKRWLAYWAAAHFRQANDTATATKPGPLDLWFGAGYEPGMKPVTEEAKRAGDWLVNQLRWPKHKIPAVVHLDDRAVCFRGTFWPPDVLANFKPWNEP